MDWVGGEFNPDAFSLDEVNRRLTPLQRWWAKNSIGPQPRGFGNLMPTHPYRKLTLHADLQQKGVRCWFAPEDLKIGDKFRMRIDESIRVYDKLMVILSENSIRSPWVEEEVEAALEKKRKQDKLVLFPIRLDDAVMETEQAWASNLRRTRHIGDFRAWKDHDRYQKSFDRLLRDLKA